MKQSNQHHDSTDPMNEPTLSNDSPDALTKEWSGVVQTLEHLAGRFANDLCKPTSELDRYELYKNLFGNLSMAYLAMFATDARYPHLYPLANSVFNWFAGNTDNMHFCTPLEDGGTYQISGYRGSVKRVVFQIGNGKFFSTGELDEHVSGRSLNEFDVDDLSIAVDGEFSVILSPSRPEGYVGDWWKLEPGTTHTFVRQISYDWLNEVDARLAIDRLDVPAAKPRLTSSEIAERLNRLALWTETRVRMSYHLYQAMLREHGVNNIAYRAIAEYGGFSKATKQGYGYGGYQLEPDEALIYEARIPKCRYWSLFLTDNAGFALDFMNRQIGLNGHTANVDPDGVFRAVISAIDPGIANWLDTCGYSQGLMSSRFEKLDADDQLPIQTLIKVKVSEVRGHLPDYTPMITAEARDEAIRRRRKAAQFRRRW